jgi:hypothetical protein
MIMAFTTFRTKCALVLFVIMLIPIIPVTSLLGLYVVFSRPIWFKQLVDKLYADVNDI